MDYCLNQRESKTLVHYTPQKPEISAVSKGYLARKGFSLALTSSLHTGLLQYSVM